MLPSKYTLFPYTTLFRSGRLLKDMGIPVYVYTHPCYGTRSADDRYLDVDFIRSRYMLIYNGSVALNIRASYYPRHERSEEHTSELQSRENLVCRLLLEKK